jgi:hypothetical protein
MKEILLSNGSAVLVSAIDFDELSKLSWYLSNKGYATTSIKKPDGRKSLSGIHRQILGLNFQDGKIVDHINGDKLDNRRENLRVCTAGENSRNQKINKRNTSGFKGVCFSKAGNKWMARIKVNWINKYLGLFDTPEQAHAAYCVAATALHGEFARFK